MRGTIRPISLPRRLIVDLMRASMGVPFVSLRRRLSVGPLAEARVKALAQTPAAPGTESRPAAGHAPGWAAIVAKAFCLVARDEPALRTLYVDWPWPYLYELPRSVGMVAIARVEDGEDCVLMQKIGAGDEMPLADVDALIRSAKTAAVDDVPAFRKMLQATRLPWPLRRLVWAFGLAVGRQRANYFGSFSVTSVAAFGPGELHALSPGPYIVTYGALEPDHSIDVMIRWDHRVADAAKIAAVLGRLEAVLNGAIADELTANQPAMDASAGSR